ncbi:uncharacterized protein LOC134273889 [Saccostrea cucullata]|uniref:uncharacterized protein LOC134273889 n=1 Tax=Saccostrea cuccullata TaxID=36930 RepID=UPI002ED0FE41
MSMRLPSSNLFGANEAPQFDTWNLANRPVICESYTLTTKYRQCKNPVTRRFKGVLGFKRKRRPESRAESEGGESNHSHGTSDIDFDKEFPDDFDYDEKENKAEEKLSNTPKVDVLIQDPPPESVTSTDIQEDTDPKTVIKRTPCQELYIRSCKFLDVIPASTFIRHLGDEKIQLRHHFLGPDGTKACCMALLVCSDVRLMISSPESKTF